MANKNVYLKLPSYSGTSGLTLILTAQSSGTIANGSGDTLTAGSNGLFSCTVTEAITGWLDVEVRQSSTTIAEGGKLYIASDTAGDYFVDDPSFLTAIKAKTDLITSTTINVVQDDTANTIYITRNDAYDGTANAKKSFTVAKDYTGWTGTLTIRHRVTNASLLSKSVTVASSTLLEVSLSSTDTAFSALVSDDEFGPHPFDVEMVSGSSKQQAVYGVAIVRKDVTS